MEIWFTFVLASTLILIIPGPTIILVIGQSVTHGRRSALPLVIGVLLGDFTAMTLSLMGLGAVMTTSATAFTLFKWLGALYLIYLGARTLLARPSNFDVEVKGARLDSSGTFFCRSFIVTALNPKSIAFFVAFLPQFIDPIHGMLSQSITYGGTFLVLATVNAALYAMFAAELKERIRQPAVQRMFKLSGGGALIGAGVITAGLKQSG